MPRTARHRLRIGLTVILCLLFQQVAIAAYAGPVSLPAEPPAVAEECADMGMDAATEVPALCAEHCSPDHAVTPETGLAHVPPLALPPTRFEPRLMPPPAHLALAQPILLDLHGPPPRLRYCSLLI